MSTAKKYAAAVPDAMPSAARDVVTTLLARIGKLPFLISVAHVPAEGVRKAFGGVVPIPEGVDAEHTWLFFVDLSPYAEWAHPCRYYFVDDEGAISAGHDDEYPPSQE